jgi:hypothetical protein
MCDHQTAGQNHNLVIDNESFESVAQAEVYGKSSNESKLHS